MILHVLCVLTIASGLEGGRGSAGDGRVGGGGRGGGGRAGDGRLISAKGRKCKNEIASKNLFHLALFRQETLIREHTSLTLVNTIIVTKLL